MTDADRPHPAIHVRPATSADRDQVWRPARDFATSFQPQRAAFERSYDLLLATVDTLVLVAETPQSEIIGYLPAGSHLTFLANGSVDSDS